jgi:DNA-binding GntR family transcriptional regulator
MSKIEFKALSDQVYDKIRRMIDDGLLVPGGKINKLALSETLGVSQTPINDALSRLTGERLVEQRSRHGYFVHAYSWEELMPIFELRAGLEGMAIRLCVENKQPSQMRRLTHAFDGFEAQVPESRHDDYLRADKLFHESIIEYSGNPFLLELMRSSGYLLKSNRRGLVRPPSETLPEHRAIIDAVLRRDAREAQEQAILHLLRSRDFMRTLKS